MLEDSVRREEAIFVSGGDDEQDVVEDVEGGQRAGLRAIRRIAHAREAVLRVLPGDAGVQDVRFDSRSQICKRRSER